MLSDTWKNVHSRCSRLKSFLFHYVEFEWGVLHDAKTTVSVDGVGESDKAATASNRTKRMLLFHEKVCRCGNPLRDVVLLIIITYLIKKKTQNITRIRSLEGYGAAFMSRLMAEGPTPKLGCIYTLLLFENHLIPSRCMGCACGPRRLQNRSHNQSPYQRLLEGSHIIWDCTSVQQHCGPSSTVRLNICLQPSVHSGTACLKKKTSVTWLQSRRVGSCTDLTLCRSGGVASQSPLYIKRLILTLPVTLPQFRHTATSESKPKLTCRVTPG